MKVDSLHFNRIVIISFQIHSAGVQSQSNKKIHCPKTFGAQCSTLVLLEPYGPWSKVVHYIGDREPFGAHT